MPKRLISLPYSGPDDLPAMINLLQALRASGQGVYPNATDLYEELADPTAASSARLWEDQYGTLVGFVYVSPWQNLVDVFRQSERTPEIELELVEWAEAAVAVAAQQRREDDPDTPPTLDAASLESDLARRAFLERHGFEVQPGSSILMARSLSLPILEPCLPPGFGIRPVGGEAEIEDYVALHRAAFGTENMTTAYRQAIMSAPDYQPELDLVAVAPDGSLAAFCVCQIFPDDRSRAGGQKEGWTDPLGTHPGYQRQGLAKALMCAGMRLLQARSVDTALLGTSSENLAMQRTAEALGFQLVSNTIWYRKLIELAIDNWKLTGK